MQVVLLSGGLDSLLCALMALKAGKLAGCVFVDYGHPSEQFEAWKAFEFCLSRGITLRVLHVIGLDLGGMGEGEGACVVPHRNAILLALAANQARLLGADELVIGANAGDRHDYEDCRLPFTMAMSGALGMPVVTPLMTWSKHDIVAKAKTLGLHQQDAWACYGPGPAQCGECRSCKASESAWTLIDKVWRTSCCGRTGREVEENGHTDDCGK